MLRKLLQKLEHPEIPYLGPNVSALQLSGLLQTGTVLKKYFYIFMHAFYFSFCISQWIDLWIVKSNPELFMFNIKFLIPLNLTGLKGLSFIIWRKKWRSIIEYVTAADKKQRNSGDDVKKNIINDYTKLNRKITCLFVLFMYSTIVIGIFNPFVKYWLSPVYRDNVKNGKEQYLEIARSWVPFDKATVPGYIAVSAIQAISALFGAGYVTSYDTNAVAVMVFFNGELQMLKRDSTLIFGTETQMLKDKDAIERIKDCHERHLELVKFARIFNSCFSPLMFMYILVLSVMICVTAYQMTLETSAIQLLMMGEYLIFAVVELFMYCWYSNEVFYMSNDLMRGPYGSLWWMADVKMRKNVIILTAQFQQSIVFTAGPFAMLTVSTFISVIKGAYSYYTLLNQAQSESK